MPRLPSYHVSTKCVQQRVGRLGSRSRVTEHLKATQLKHLEASSMWSGFWLMCFCCLWPYESFSEKMPKSIGKPSLQSRWKFKENKKRKIVNCTKRGTFLLLSMTSCKTSHSRASSVSMSGSEMFKVEISSPPVTSVEELLPVSGSAKSSEISPWESTLKMEAANSPQHHHGRCFKDLRKILAKLLLLK